MRRYSALAGFCLTFILHSFPAWAQGKAPENRYLPASALKVEELAASREIEEPFGNWVERMEERDGLGAFDEANRILNAMRSLGTKNLFSVADMMLAMGRAALGQGDAPSAVAAGQHAVMLAPDHPDAHFFLARALFVRDKTDIRSAVTELAAGTEALFSDRIQRGKFTAYAVRSAYLALLVAFLLTFLSYAALHYRALLSDIADFVPSRPEGAWKGVIGALVLLVPLAAGGWLLFLLAIPLFLWPYLRPSGKSVVVLFALFIFSGPYVFEWMARGITLSNADTYRALYLLSRDTWDYSTKKTLERERTRRPGDTLIPFALGLLNKLKKDKDAALEAYDALLAKNPKSTRALVNKGNVYFMAKEHDMAVAMYKEALKADPQLVEAHFNLSNAYAFMAKTKDSEKEYNMALSIDLDRTRRLVEMAEEGYESKVVDFNITPKDLAEFERGVAEETKAVSEVLWNVYFGPISAGLYQSITAGFLLLLVFSQLFWSRRTSHHACVSCGAPFRPPIRLSSSYPKCNQCVAAQLSKGGVSSAKKDKKRKEMREFMDRMSRTATWLDRILPGLGRSYYHEIPTGFIFAFITSLMIVYGVAVIGSELLVYKNPLSLDLAREHAVFLGAAVLYWVLMNTVIRKDFY